jgi:hypothetical protein
MMAIQFDKDLAISTFVERKTKNAGKQIDNSTLYAGSPMYYYCRHCECHTQTLSESHSGRPITVCTPCEALDVHGLIDKAKAAYAESKKATAAT